MKRWNVAEIRASKGVRKLGCCTAYDAAFARLADEAGVPVLLVGDSMGMNTLGYSTTLPVKLEETLSAVAAVARAAKEAMVVADLPFGTYQCGDDEAMKNAVRCLQAGADAVKLEGADERICALIKRMTNAGIPVLAHVGMTPQSVNSYGGFKRQGRTREEAERIFRDAKAVEKAGAFAVTLECVPAELAAEITAALEVPTVGIGAGAVCDAQWLVMHDMLGLNEKVPSFVRKYADLASVVKDAFSRYVKEVASGEFP
ncbi:MAG: 3-methyl-2-oxobutanoate hydroxymethyltransferase [Kiritimatiellae bacterium]|jgi:3-methyl-2-oxobutanoate hydroxymethyltransferase|nr:3-methyl-2-oxobutanoate hydroxymethyltransferase [Kiritimatiellia bacterium]